MELFFSVGVFIFFNSFVFLLFLLLGSATFGQARNSKVQYNEKMDEGGSGLQSRYRRK
jgi:hypothetical protein